MIAEPAIGAIVAALARPECAYCHQTEDKHPRADEEPMYATMQAQTVGSVWSGPRSHRFLGMVEATPP